MEKIASLVRYGKKIDGTRPDLSDNIDRRLQEIYILQANNFDHRYDAILAPYMDDGSDGIDFTKCASCGHEDTEGIASNWKNIEELKKIYEEYLRSEEDLEDLDLSIRMHGDDMDPESPSQALSIITSLMEEYDAYENMIEDEGLHGENALSLIQRLRETNDKIISMYMRHLRR